MINEKWMADHIKKLVPEAHWDRVENAAGTGMADLNGCFLGHELWLEMKLMTNFRLHKIQPSQVPWHTKRWAVGGLNYFMLYDTTYQRWWYVQGRDAFALMDVYRGRRQLPIEMQHPVADLKTWLLDRFTGFHR